MCRTRERDLSEPTPNGADTRSIKFDPETEHAPSNSGLESPTTTPQYTFCRIEIQGASTPRPTLSHVPVDFSFAYPFAPLSTAWCRLHSFRA